MVFFEEASINWDSVKIAGCNLESPATDWSNSGTALYKSKQLESIFIEVNINNEKVQIGELSQFKSDYLTKSFRCSFFGSKTV